MDFGPYGNTWWCQKWLETLLSGADANTVATGMRYAMREQVKSIDIVDNRVISVVKGPNGGLHNNYIVFPLFPRERCEAFGSLLRQQPSEMLALGNKVLNTSIEILLAKSGLKLFDDLEKVKVGCDCRDPLPCKYTVATFLKIAEQANSDPGVLFKLHGMDLAHYRNAPATQLELDAPAEASLIRTLDKAQRIVDEGEAEAGSAPNRVDDLDLSEDSSASLFATEGSNRTPPQQLPHLDFDAWKDYSRVLPAMLQNFPKFCPAGNFRKSFTDELDGCHKFFCSYENFGVFSEHFRAYNAKTFLMENANGAGLLNRAAMARSSGTT